MSKSRAPLVMGAGSWGTSLALVLAKNGHDIYLWDIDQKLIQIMQNERENVRYIPSVTLPDNIFPIKILDSVPQDIDLCLLTVPCHALRASLKLVSHLKSLTFCLACKGFEPETQKLNHTVVLEEYPDAVVAVLTGPSFAKEVAKGLPTAVTIASATLDSAQQVADYFHSEYFRIYTHDDLIGAQIGGAVKNVIAIAAGIADGLGFGANTRAALISRGLREIMQLGLALGAKPETFMGLSGLGDLVLTCTDDQSRNRRLGMLLAKGLTVEESSQAIGQSIEGLKTALEVNQHAKTLKVEMPITVQVFNVITDKIQPCEAVKNLLSREQKAEID